MKVPSPITTSRLPSSTALQGPSGAGGTPEAFGAGVARSIANLAGSTMALGAQIRAQEDKKNRFLALRNFSAFQADTALEFTELQRNYDPKQGNYYEQASELYRTREKKFLDTYIPPELRDEFSVRTAEVGAGHALNAAEFQYKANDNLFKQGINDALNEARITIGQDGSKETLERERQKLDEIIESTNLGVAEKVAIRRQVYEGLEGVAYRAAQIQRLRDEQSGVGTDVDQATELLRVQGRMDTEDAAASVVTGRNVAVEAVGSVDAWAALPSRMRAVLIAVAAEKGELSNAMIEAARSGDAEKLVAVLRAEGGDVAQTGGDLIMNPEAGIDDDPAFSNLPYEDRLALFADAEREVSAEIAASAKAEKEHRASLVNALHVGLLEGDAGQADIDKMIELRVLDDYDDRKKAYDILAERDEELSLQQLGLAMLNGSMTFAPGNKDHEKALNALVGKEGLASIDNMDSEFAAAGLIPLVRQAQGVPSDVVDLLQGMIRSQNPNKAYWALDLMAQIERTSPKGFLSFPEKDQKSVDLWQLRKDYMSQEDLLARVRGPMDEAERNARTALRKQGAELFTNENAPGSLVNFNPVSLFSYPGWLGLPSGAGPPVNRHAEEQLNADFQTLFLDNYEIHVDVETAKQAAQQQLQRVWGVTRTGIDNRLMKYPPEMIYPQVRESHDWMEAQLRREGILADDEQFGLITDEQTESEWGTSAAPSYVLAKIVDGVTELELDPATRLPIRVNFDFGAEEEADEKAWRDEQRREQEADELQKQMDDAVSHSIDTGTPIPGEFFNNFDLTQALINGEAQ